MKPDKLVRMANQFASFFRSYPDDQAKAGIRDHIVQFWTADMRATLAAHVDAGGDDLDPLVLAALRREQPATSPIAKTVAAPAELGQLASDTG